MIKLLLVILLIAPFFNACAYDDHLTYYDLMEYEKHKEFEDRIRRQEEKWERDRERDLQERSDAITKKYNKTFNTNKLYDDYND